MRAAVIGGGIIGAASAYYLSERGIEVDLFEKSAIGAGSTGAGGGIRTQFSTGINVELSLRSLEVWRSFESQFDVDIRPKETGYLLLARTPETADALAADAELQNGLGATTEILTGEEAKEVCPGLHAERYIAAAYSPHDLFVDANLALQGFATAARLNGATMHIGEPITDIVLDDDGVTGVRWRDGEISTDVVVNAAGAWAHQILTMAELSLPVRPGLRRQLLVQPTETYDPTLPLTFDRDTGAVFYPEDEEYMIVSGPQDDLPAIDPDIGATEPDTAWTIQVMEAVGEVASYFGEDSRIREELQGLYAVTPDRNPIVEETMPGFINAIGFSGHGFMHAPAIGDIVADLATHSSPPIDISSLTSERFAEQSGAEQSFI